MDFANPSAKDKITNQLEGNILVGVSHEDSQKSDHVCQIDRNQFSHCKSTVKKELWGGINIQHRDRGLSILAKANVLEDRKCNKKQQKGQYQSRFGFLCVMKLYQSAKGEVVKCPKGS